ncbi:MAG: 50S ribosomal protein L34 [Candidatus Omnitrophica bacterium]|nr:50S ribosomal protein L34 [Candidatus Omnitrophota bacterium]
MKKHLTRKSLRKGKRKHGFRTRMASSTGRRILKRRRRKGKHKLTI